VAVDPSDFEAWAPGPLGPEGAPYLSFSEPPSEELAWLNLNLYHEVRAQGRSLFLGTLSERNALWREFRNYLRQARTYYESGSRVDGSSSCLLMYYAFLNLAKAELLRTNSRQVVGQTIRHGLSYNPTRARSALGDVLAVTDGVFPLLYAKRTGRTLPTGTQLPITRLLANVPEIAWEVTQLDPSPRNHSVPVFHSIVSDGARVWSVLAIHDNPFLDNRRSATMKLVRKHFFEVTEPPRAHSVFASATRYSMLGSRFFEAIEYWEIPDPHTMAELEPITSVASADTWSKLRDILDEPFVHPSDAVMCPSLYVSRMVPMPASMARYALTFYVSSLVRYKPSQLDPQTFGDQAWLLDSYARQSPFPLLLAALNGISGSVVRFSPVGGRA